MPLLSTTTWNDCFELTRNMGSKKMQTDGYDVKICQLVAQRMYTYRPWKFSLKTAPINAVPLVNGVQDYPAPQDIYDLESAWITVTYPAQNGQPAGIDQNWNLDVVDDLTPDLNPTGFLGNGCITLLPNLQQPILRLGNAIQPPTPTNPSFLNCRYQPKMKKVIDMSMPLPFPDEYSGTAVEGIQYWLYKFGDDDRAGTVVKQGNAIEYTGQLGVFEAFLARNAVDDQASEVSNFFPSDSLGHRWNWGPYPYIWVY